MNSAWVGVIGVAVGAVLGAVLGSVAQIVADWLRANRESNNEARRLMREAYTEALAAYQEGVHQFGLASGARTSNANTLFETFMQDGLGAMKRLNVATARVTLVAPNDTSDAARKMSNAMADIASKAQGKDVEITPKPLQDFVELARRDLKPGVVRSRT